MIALAQSQPKWAVGFQDEVWWSREVQPHLHAWTADPERLHLVEQEVPDHDPDPKALSCYGVSVRVPAQAEATWVRFVEGRPVSAITVQFLEWGCQRLQQHGMQVWVLIWDNASWHRSKLVRDWMRVHNRRVKQTGMGVRILTCFLPTKSPWLNAIEPKWVHGKKAIVEPTARLSTHQIAERVCAYFQCPLDPYLAIPQEVL